MGNRFSSILEKAIDTLYNSPRPSTNKISIPRIWDLVAEDKKYVDGGQLAKQVNKMCLKLINSYPSHLVSGIMAKTVVVGTIYMVQVARGKHYPIYDCEDLIEIVLGETVDRKSISNFYKKTVNYESVRKALREINKSCGMSKIPARASPKLVEVFKEG